MQAGGKDRRLGPGQHSVNMPVFLRLESLYFRFPITDEPDGHRLHPAGAQPPAHGFPQQRADFIPHQPVEDPPRLLGVNPVLVNSQGRFQRLLDGLGSNLMEKNPIYAFPAAQLPGNMPGDGFPLTVGVGSQVDGIGRFRRLFQLTDDLALAANSHIVGRKFPIGGDVDAQFLFGQVFHVSDGRLNLKAFAQIFLYGSGLGRRLNNQQ